MSKTDKSTTFMYRKLAKFDFSSITGPTFEKKSYEFQMLGNAILTLPDYACHRHFVREKR